MDSKINKTMLLAGDPWLGSTTYSMLHGFRQLGWGLLNINPSNYMVTSKTLTMKIVNRLAKHIAVDSYNDSLIEMIEVCRPDVLMIVKGNYIKADTLREIKNMGVITVNYYPDVHFSFNSFYKDTINCYDYIFTTKSFQIDYLYKNAVNSRVEYLPHGYSDHFHKFANHIISNNYENDLLYVGTYNDEKKFWLEGIRNNFPTLKLKIYGNGWNVKRSVLSSSVVGSPIFGYKYSRAISLAKINLAIHMGPTDNSGWSDLVSTRTFEIPACKGFMLHVDNQEVRGFFEPEKEIDVFSAQSELFNKIEHYLTNDALRKEMLENAFRRCVPAYGYNQRAKVISDILIERLQ